MKVFVTGVNGQLGHDCVNEIISRGYNAIASDIQDKIINTQNILNPIDYIQLDITDENAVINTLQRIKPDAIIHCAAWTAVDAAEDEINQQKVQSINALGTQYIAEAAKNINSKMLYLSTDYVFDGKGTLPWQPRG